ncbi:MAG TPA: carboxypeptidase M32 [Anaerolineaceae bacterium]|nr:carboxypeptidase M32 [Anaerolineaceae bacterium]
MSAYDEFNAYIGKINDLCCVLNLLTWDARTQMPEGGTLTRGSQISTVAGIAQEMFASLKTLQLIEAAENEVAGEPTDSYRVRAVRYAREHYEVAQRIPSALVAELNELKTIAQAVWIEARKNDDYPLFAPYLEKIVKIQRRIASAVGYSDHPYDALLLRYEPGMTATCLHDLFAQLKAGLTPVLERARVYPEAPHDFLTRFTYPADQQKAFATEIAKKFGYDFKRGRVDQTVHPFEISFTRQDVRITTRYDEHYPPQALFGLFHETGHALYEQGADPAITRTALATDLLDLYAVAGTSYGLHESQSRLWENLIGRSRTFWQNHFPLLQSYFPEQLDGIDAEQFYRAVNRVKPSLIRTESDEVTYNFHIMIRVEIEMGLLDGSISIDELPTVWSAKYQQYLGVTPPNNRLGVLQDIHWSSGLFGSFCSYTLGNVISAQLFEAALQQNPQIEPALNEGQYQPLLSWLTEQVYRHGHAFRPDELLQRATGSPLNVEPYFRYIHRKYDQLFPPKE